MKGVEKSTLLKKKKKPENKIRVKYMKLSQIRPIIECISIKKNQVLIIILNAYSPNTNTKQRLAGVKSYHKS